MNVDDRAARPHVRRPAVHSAQLRHVYDRVLAGASVRSRFVDVGVGDRVHLLEKGTGPSVVVLHGTGNPAGFLLPLLNDLEGVRALAPDRPGIGLSDPIDQPRGRFREIAVAWLDDLLDTLGLETTTLLGHSGGAVWALWYALAHPDRVTRLVLIGPPALPKTRCPLPLRVAATPGAGDLLSRLMRPTPKSMLKFADQVAGEKTTLAAHPDLVDLLVAAGRDPVTDRAARAELRMFVSPFALLSRSGFRRRSSVRPDELSRLAMPTLLMWGKDERLGSVAVARAAADLMQNARLEVPPTGHAPWLGRPAQTAASVADFVRREQSGPPTTSVRYTAND